METVLDALKAMKKATYREVAARLDIEPVEALNMLREHKQQGLCDFFDGAWSLGTVKEQKPKRISPECIAGCNVQRRSGYAPCGREKHHLEPGE